VLIALATLPVLVAW